MLVKIPTIITKDNQPYKLFLDYQCDKNDVWKWRATYVSEPGILFRSNPSSRLGDVENEVFEFMEKNKLE